MNGPAGRIGIVAGGGTLPGEVAHSVVNRGGSVHIIMLEGADPALRNLSAYVRQLGSARTRDNCAEASGRP